MSSTSLPDAAPSDFRSLLASTWAALQQPPPPSMREVLSAYNAKGTGDRDMLLAMLNAKSAEDNRIAAMTSLQNTMLQFYTRAPSPPQHWPAPSAYPSPREMHQPAPLSPDSLSHSTLPHHQHVHHQHLSRQAYHSHPRDNDHPDEPPRKRSRQSRSRERDFSSSSRPHSPIASSSRHTDSHLRRRPSFSHAPLAHSNSNTLPPLTLSSRPMVNRNIESLLSAGAADAESWGPGPAARTSAERSTAPSATLVSR